MNGATLTLNGFKYIYLFLFFLLLSGIFYPLITNTNFDNVVGGVFVLFLGLIGSILLYHAAISERKTMVYTGMGLGLITLSLYLIFYLTGRI